MLFVVILCICAAGAVLGARYNYSEAWCCNVCGRGKPLVETPWVDKRGLVCMDCRSTRGSNGQDR